MGLSSPCWDRIEWKRKCIRIRPAGRRSWKLLKFTKMIGKSQLCSGINGLKELSLCSFAKIKLPKCQRLRSLGSFLVWVTPGKTKNHGTWKCGNHDFWSAVRFWGYGISDLSCTAVSSYARSFLNEMWTHPQSCTSLKKKYLRPFPWLCFHVLTMVACIYKSTEDQVPLLEWLQLELIG